MNVHIITGQTATGKTSLALKKAREVKSDIISADSRHIYKFLDNVTGKDINGALFTKVSEFQSWAIGYYMVEGVKIWGMDIIDPHQTFSSYNYREYVAYILSNTIAIESTPIVIGGSYFYIQHLLNMYDFEAPPDWDLRESLAQKPVSILSNMLKAINPQIYDNMNESDQRNPHRLIRRIEIASFQKTHQPTQRITKLPIEQITWSGLAYELKEDLAEAIRARVEKRLQTGAIEETKKLLEMGYTRDDPGLKTIGYQQIISYLQGELTENKMKEEWTTAEVQYAKRQYTFMKKNPDIEWTFI